MEELFVETSPKSSIAEAIRIIRTNVLFASVNESVKTILVTSSVPGEGKSFISANLAAAFAQNDLKVLLIDCDLRKGRLHKIFKMSNEKGLSNLLLDDVENEYKHYIRKTKVDNLYIMSKGIVPPNPSELLDSAKTRVLLNIVRSKFDIVILDGTPVGGLTDSMVLTKYADQVVVVTACNYTKMEQLQTTLKSLESVNAKIAGVIVNKTTETHSSYYGNYYE